MEQRLINYLAKGSPKTRTTVAGVGLVLIGSLWVIAEELTIARSNQITLFSAFLSGVLTLHLIWIYLMVVEETNHQTSLQKQVMEIQSQQTNIMERQEKLMVFQYIPRIRLQNFELLRENGIELTLTNVGNGLAEMIFLRTMVFVRPTPDELAECNLVGEVISLNDQKFALLPGYTPLMRDDGNLVASYLSGESLRSDESEVTFKSRVQLGVEPVPHTEDQYGCVLLSEILDEIEGLGHDSVHVELSIVYSDLVGGIHTEYVLGRTVGLGTGDRELVDLINTDFITHWKPMGDNERAEVIKSSNIYPNRCKPN